MQFLQLHQIPIKCLLIGFITLNYFFKCSNSSKDGLPHADPLCGTDSKHLQREQTVSNEASFSLEMPRNDILGEIYSTIVILCSQAMKHCCALSSNGHWSQSSRARTESSAHFSEIP